eukprot:scaffold224070_cov37-Prasinocladus_malaysianus.AAC.1
MAYCNVIVICIMEQMRSSAHHRYHHHHHHPPHKIFCTIAVLAAMIGLVILLATGVVTWDDALEEKGAWDTLVWFTILISLSAQLNALGVVDWLASSVSSVLTAMKLGWMQAFGVLHLG